MLNAMETPKHLLVPVDFSRESARALRYAMAFAKRYEAHLTVLHVWDPPSYIGRDILIALGDEKRASDTNSVKLADLARMHVDSEMKELLADIEENKSVSLKVKLRFGHPARSIVMEAKDEAYDLILMGTHSRSSIGRFVLGSVTQRVIQLAPCPVLTVPSEAVEQEKAA